jgi:hypothetical protein
MIEETDKQVNVLTPNPLMTALRVPGETFRLPSHGLFYNEGVLDETVKNGEVEVYPMTAIDEIIISTPDKLLSGKAISEVFAHCIPQIKNTHQLLAKDVDFLMVCLRMVAFGQHMEVLYTHNCENAVEHTYSIDLQSIIRSTKSIDPTTLNQEYTCNLTNGQVVLLRPMTYGDIIELYQATMSMNSDDTDSEDAAKLVIATLVSVIRQVNDITDKKLIHEWASALALGHKKKIQEGIQSASTWGVDMSSIQVCPDCGEQTELRVNTNPISFFI